MYFIEGTGKVPTFNYGQIVEKINHLVPLLSAGNSEERESSLRELKSILTSVSNKDFLLQLADNIIISLGTHLPSGILPEITDFLYNLHKEENMAQSRFWSWTISRKSYPFLLSVPGSTALLLRNS